MNLPAGENWITHLTATAGAIPLLWGGVAVIHRWIQVTRPASSVPACPGVQRAFQRVWDGRSKTSLGFTALSATVRLWSNSLAGWTLMPGETHVSLITTGDTPEHCRRHWLSRSDLEVCCDTVREHAGLLADRGQANRLELCAIKCYMIAWFWRGWDH
jgi:hypothetical protein